jgi:hypothetical protein
MARTVVPSALLFFWAVHVNLQCSKMMSEVDAQSASKEIAKLIADLASYVVEGKAMPEEQVKKLIDLFRQP